MQPQPQARIPALLVLQDRNFRTIWYASILGQLARHMEMLVLSWFILQETDSIFNLGLILVFYVLPRTILSMPAGMIADRFNRQRVMLAARSLSLLTASSILILIASGLIEPWHALAAPFMHGITSALEDPSRRTAIFDIVGQGRVVSAMSLEMIANNSGKLIGPILGGVLLSLAGFTGAYSMVALLHLFTLGLLFWVKVPQTQRSTIGERLWNSLVVAVRYAFHSPMLLGVLYITLFLNFLIFPLQQFVPAVGRDHLGVGAALVGLLVASDGVGQLISTGFMASMKNFRHHGRVFVLGSVTLVVMAVLFVWSPWYALSFAFFTCLGIGQGAFSTMQSSIAMLWSPPEIRGRMMGLVSICIGVALPLGALYIAIAATVFSTQWTFSVNAAVGLVLFLPALVLTPLVLEPSRQHSQGTVQS